MADLDLPFCEEGDQHEVRRDVSERGVSELLKPFAAFGLDRQMHGGVLDYNADMGTIEAPPKLESECSLPNDCEQGSTLQRFKPYGKPYHRRKSFSSDLDRALAWERKKQQYLFEEEIKDSDSGEEYGADDLLHDDLIEKEPADESFCGSDYEDGTREEDGKDDEKHIREGVEGGIVDAAHLDFASGDEEDAHAPHEDGFAMPSKRMTISSKKVSTGRPARTKSLTDDDMEELRGSIDLGFGFLYSEHTNLKSTLPALELYYAINKNYVESQSRSMPGSPLHGSAFARTNSSGSASSPSNEAWRISSPGDHPSQVKSRLRHWAQAVACAVKQGN